METPHNSSLSSSYSPDPIEIGGNQMRLPFEDQRICKLKFHIWHKLILLLNILSVILSSCAFITPRWIEQGNKFNFWRGSILKCGGCSGIFYNQSYNEISNYSCDSMEGYCETFSRLFRAGVALILVECVFFILSTTWIVITICELMDIRSKSKIIPSIVILTPSTQIIGLLAWLGVSGARIDSDCYEFATSMDISQPLCATHGPIIIIVSILLAFISCSAYFFIRYAIKKQTKNKIIPAEVEE